MSRCDVHVTMLLDAYPSGCEERADVLACTGMSADEYRDARRRLDRLVDALPDNIKDGATDALEVSYGYQVQLSQRRARPPHHRGDPQHHRGRPHRGRARSRVRPADARSDRLRHAAVMRFFVSVKNKDDLDVCVAVLEPVDIRAEFDQAFKRFAQSLDMMLPDPSDLGRQLKDPAYRQDSAGPRGYADSRRVRDLLAPTRNF